MPWPCTGETVKVWICGNVIEWHRPVRACKSMYYSNRDRMQIEISQFSWLRFSCCYDIHSITRSRPIRELLGTGWWIRRTSNLKFEILLHRKSTMSSENDETRPWKVMWCRFGDMGSLNLKWGRNSDGHNCRSVDWFGTIQEYISYLLLHARHLKVKLDDKGFVLK